MEIWDQKGISGNIEGQVLKLQTTFPTRAYLLMMVYHCRASMKVYIFRIARSRVSVKVTHWVNVKVTGY